MKFIFNFDRNKSGIIKYAVIGLTLSSIIAGISRCIKIDEKVIWDVLDETQRKYFPDTTINNFIIKDPEKLQRRIHRDVDRAIKDVTPEYDAIIEKYNTRYKPVYIEEPSNEETCYTKECKSLAPPMRICAPWAESCPGGVDIRL